MNGEGKNPRDMTERETLIWWLSRSKHPDIYETLKTHDFEYEFIREGKAGRYRWKFKPRTN